MDTSMSLVAFPANAEPKNVSVHSGIKGFDTKSRHLAIVVLGVEFLFATFFVVTDRFFMNPVLFLLLLAFIFIAMILLKIHGRKRRKAWEWQVATMILGVLCGVLYFFSQWAD